MRLHLLLILLLVGFSFGSDANYIISLKETLKVKSLHASALEQGRAHAGGIKALQSETLESQKDVVRELKSRGVEVKHQYWLTSGLAVYIPPEKLAEIESLPEVERISPNGKVFLLRQNADPVIGAPYAWNLGLNGSGLKIAIVDTGINKTHPELIGRVINETDFATGGDPRDYNGHGTHVTGIAAGSQYGVARNVSILNAKVLDNSGSGYLSDVKLGIEWAVLQGADVISLSVGSTNNADICTGDVLSDAVESAVTNGVVVVVAAGNSGPGGNSVCRHTEDSSGNSYSVCSPGCSKKAVTVGATNNVDSIASFSSRGPTQDGRIKPDLTAPGVGINSTWYNGGYNSEQGTSQATPFVSGAVILLLEKKPSLTPQMLKAVLMNSAKDLGSAGADDTYGAGRLNISEAIRQTDLVIESTVSAGANKTYPIYVSNSNFSLRATLYWSEAWNGTEDLNLTLISPNGTVFSNSNSNEVFEQVNVSQPQNGKWQLVVSSDTNRSFALAFSQNSTFNISIVPQAQNVTLDSAANFTILIDSVAEFNDSFTVTASVFEYSLSNSPANVSANSSANVTLSVIIPANITAGNYPFVVSVLSNATNRTSEVVLTLNIFSNMTISLLPVNNSFRGHNLTIRVNATNPDLNITVINPSLVAYLQSPSGANYSQIFSYSGGLHVGSFPVPPNASLGVWNITVNSTNPFYNTAPVNSTFTVFGRINATIITNQSMIAGNPYSVNSTIFDEAGNPVSANVSWYLNGTNIANGTSFLFQPLEADVGNRTLFINATKQYYSDGIYSINLTILNPPPTITNLTLLPSHLLLPNETMNVSALVTDNLNVSAVWANMTFPNSSAQIFYLNGSGSYFSILLNFSVNGTYYLNLFANDSLGNTANLSDNFFIFQPANISFNINAMGVLRILPQNYNETRNSTNASASMLLPSAEYRLRLELGNDSVQFNNVPLTSDAGLNLTALPKNISDNEVFLPVNAYAVSTSANFSSARVSFAYNSTVNSSRLSLFRCTSADYRNCTSISTSIDSASRIAYADVQNFSIYTLGLNKTFSASILSYTSTVKSGDSMSVVVNVALDGAPVSDANFSVSVGSTGVTAGKSFSGANWSLSFNAPSLSDGAQTLAVLASYGARSAVDSKTITYYTPAQQTTTFSPGGYYSATTYKNAINATVSNKTAQNITEEERISLEISDLEANVSIYTGSEEIIPVSVFNSGAREFVTVSLSGIDPSLFFSDSGFVNSSGTRKFSVLLKIPIGTATGNYTIYADALVGGKVQASRPFLLEILEKPANATKNESRIIAKASTLTKTVRGELPVVQLDLITEKPELVIANYLVKNAETGEVVSNYSEPFFLEKSGTISRKINVPKNLTAGIYVIEAVFSYNGKTAKDITTFEALPSVPQKLPERLEIPYFQFAVLLVFAALAAAIAYSIRKKPVQKKREERLFLDAKEVPKAGLYIGKIKSSPIKAYFRLNDLLLHAIAAGGTGSGKTVAVMDIVEEALSEGIKVIVFDPTAQWTGFPKPAGVEMLGRYAEFGMGGKENKGYPANIIDASGPEVPVDLKSLPAGLTVFDMHNLKVKDLDKFIENSISSIFASSLPESKSLKYLIIYDEIHRSLPKYGGKKSYTALERGCREFRKWGIGLIMISQVLSDFRGAIRANIGTELQMRTKYEADIGRMKSKYGAEYARHLTRLRIGEGILQNPEYNSGKPYLVQFRPLRHSESRATEEELKKYRQITERADTLDDKAAKMKAKKPYGLDEELALAREKSRLFAFRMAETYLDSVEEKINSIQKD